MKVFLKKMQKITVKDRSDIYPVMQEILLREDKNRRNQECIWVVGLNTLSRIEFVELVALGTTNSAGVRALEIFSHAVEVKCDCIILVHNHPSGSMQPSQEDLRLTERMVAAGRILGIQVVDHLIISEKEYCSILQQALKNSVVLDLFPSTCYMLPLANDL